MPKISPAERLRVSGHNHTKQLTVPGNVALSLKNLLVARQKHTGSGVDERQNSFYL